MIGALAAALFFAFPVVSFPQDFGQNQVRFRGFEWRVRSTEHFDIHYYAESEPLLPFAAESLERHYARLKGALDVGFESRRPFFLYASPNDMEQSTIVDVGDGTGGVTEAFKDRFMVYHDGSRRWLDEVIGHELTHVFQYRILLSGFWRSGRIVKTLVYPLWMMEGMPEFFTRHLDETPGEALIRDAATSDGLIPLWKLEHFSHLKPHQIRLAYESGGKAMEFLESEYGRGTVQRLIKRWDSGFETSSVLQDVVGQDIFALDRRWREYEKQRCARQVRAQRLQEPAAYGERLTSRASGIPEYNASPVFTPDGKRMAFLSTRDGHPASVVLMDLATRKRTRLVSHDFRVENIPMGNFADLSRTLAISPDGRRLAFAGTKNHRDFMALYDLQKRSLRRIRLPDLRAASQPAFSPDGKTLAFSGMRDMSTDIYLLDLATGELRRLNSDPQDDQMPNFSPDGKAIVYSSEVRTPAGAEPYGRRLYRLRVADGAIEPLPDTPGCARDPVHSPDGKRLLFSLEREGTQEVMELEFETGRVRRLTRSIGAAYTPVYTPSGGIAFAGLRNGDVHIYNGSRERFLDEEEIALASVPLQVEFSSAAVLSAARPASSPFSTDIFLPAFFYASNGGLFWTSYWQGSDLLGLHEAGSFVTYASGQGMLDYQTVYRYKRWRTELGFGATGRWRRQAYDGDTGLTAREFSHVEAAQAAYPLDRYHRLELALGEITDWQYYPDTGQVSNREARVCMAAFVRDAVRGRYLVATSGSRLRLSYLASPHALGGHYTYQTTAGEAHQYLPTGGQSAVALRLLGVRSWGAHAPRYAVGGAGGVRGYPWSSADADGPLMGVGTAEWRVPLFSNLDYYMWYIFPDFYFKSISLALFTDVGRTWDTESQVRATRWPDLHHSYGGGLRLHTFVLQLFPLVIHFDYARRTTSKDGIFYVYLGPLF